MNSQLAMAGLAEAAALYGVLISFIVVFVLSVLLFASTATERQVLFGCTILGVAFGAFLFAPVTSLFTTLSGATH